MDKNEYIRLLEVSGFLDYFKAVVFGGQGSFCQTYMPKNKKVNGELFLISSFKEAYEQYRWDEKSFEDNKKMLNKFSEQLQTALTNSNNQAALIQSLKILDWGGVVIRHSVRWLVDAFEAGQICQDINNATSILDSTDGSRISEFEDNKPLRSDSATTKVFSLASKNSIVYDDRVGAALARITRSYLESSGRKKVPDHLNFMRGSANKKARNPSTKQYRFRCKDTGQLHALSNIRANWLTQEVIKDSRFEKHFCCPGKNNSGKLRMLEAALFMIGYDLTKIARISGKAKKATKKDLAKELFVRGEIDGLTPKQIKDAFMKDVALTENGANTYFYNFKNNIW